MATDITHNTGNSTYILAIDGETAAYLRYTRAANAIYFTSTYTQPQLRGQGLASQVVEHAVNDVESHSELPIVPTCSYVTQWFGEHPERAGLLTR